MKRFGRRARSRTWMGMLLCAALLLGLCPTHAAAVGGLSNFRSYRAYEPGRFSDVAEADWYAGSVEAVYRQGLMNGETDDYFNAGGYLSVLQAIVLAARLHAVYYSESGKLDGGEPWYKPYVDYAAACRITAGGEELDERISRGQFADILSRCLPRVALQEISSVEDGAIPDVRPAHPYAEGIYRLYRAGIVTGSNGHGRFFPATGITRAEAAAIVARMTDPALRKRLTLARSWPDLKEQAEMGEDFFANAALLGNSLAEGLRTYSGLKSLHYFSATSVSVFSAMNSRVRGGKTLVQELCAGGYDKVYIELGINEISLPADSFAQSYREMVQTIQDSLPEAEIYILAVLPVTRGKSAQGVYTMERVNTFNERLRALAQELGCWYMDVCSPYLDEDGYLDEGRSWDGVHFQPKEYAVWENTMRTRYA